MEKHKQIKSTKIEKRKVKGSMITTKDGTHFRKSYERNMKVTTDTNDKSFIKSVLTNDMLDSNIVSMKKLKDNAVSDEIGVTDNVLRVNMEKGGATHVGYFKAAQHDAFITEKTKKFVKGLQQFGTDFLDLDAEKVFLRDSIKLRDRKTEKELTQDEHIEAESMPDMGMDKYKGHMMYREVATSALSKMLGMEHLPDMSMRQIEQDGVKKTGIMVRDVLDQFTNKDTSEITKGHNITKAGKNILENSDVKVGDKAAFDFLIGNLDRHANNYFVRKDNAGRMDMIGFDQGLSFPSHNKSLSRYYTVGAGSRQPGLNKDVTPAFIQKLGDMVASDNFTELQTFIKNNVGEAENESFLQRVAVVLQHTFNKNKFSIGSMDIINNKNFKRD